jgi:DNA-binding NarL/FixJ family response regulator
MTISIVVVDDQELVRAGFRTILRSDPELDVVAEAADGVSAVGEVLAHRPDVVVMDIRMPRSDGIQATAEITARMGADAPRVIILTTFDADALVFDALEAGASAYLLKDVTREELVRAVHVVHGGDALLAPSLTRRFIGDMAARRRAEPGPEYERLTDRERETLLRLAAGRSNAELAADLGISEATAKTHVAHTLEKLGLRDRVHAVIYAYEHGLV